MITATLKFDNDNARRAFRSAWRKRLSFVGYSKEQIDEIIRTALAGHHPTAFVFGRDDAERVCDIANEVPGVECKLSSGEDKPEERPSSPSTGLTPAMETALAIARRDGVVVAGKGEHGGHVERVSASAIRALIKRGLLVHTYGSEGGFAGRLVK